MFWTRSKSFFPRSTFSDSLSLFNRFLAHDADDVSSSFPAFNIWSDDNGAIITSEMPGVSMDDLEITVSGKNVVVKGARHENDDFRARYARHERPAGEFARTFKLPFQIDAGQVEARLTDGVLRVDLPRAENDKPRKISVISA